MTRTGQGGIHGDFGSFSVAKLAHDDHIRIMAQYRAQYAGEGQPDRRIHGNLIDAFDLVFDRNVTISFPVREYRFSLAEAVSCSPRPYATGLRTR